MFVWPPAAPAYQLRPTRPCQVAAVAPGDPLLREGRRHLLPPLLLRGSSPVCKVLTPPLVLLLQVWASLALRPA